MGDFYAGAAAVCTGIGALIGWAIDAANSKPHIRFDASSGGRTKVSVQPVFHGVAGSRSRCHSDDRVRLARDCPFYGQFLTRWVATRRVRR